MYFKQKNSLKNRSDLPDNSITSNVYFAMNNRYSISNDMSERPISLLKEKFSVSESHEIKYDSKNAYCLLMNEIETDNLYQDDELNNKFYGVFSDTADDEFFGIYIFDGEKKENIWLRYCERKWKKYYSQAWNPDSFQGNKSASMGTEKRHYSAQRPRILIYFKGIHRLFPSCKRGYQHTRDSKAIRTQQCRNDLEHLFSLVSTRRRTCCKCT